MEKKEREEMRDVTQTKEKLFGMPPRCCMQLVSLKYIAVLQKQAAKACWKCCKNTNFCYRNFLCIHRKFLAKYYDIKI
jgi:hypothetical protein